MERKSKLWSAKLPIVGTNILYDSLQKIFQDGEIKEKEGKIVLDIKFLTQESVVCVFYIYIFNFERILF